MTYPIARHRKSRKHRFFPIELFRQPPPFWWGLAAGLIAGGTALLLLTREKKPAVPTEPPLSETERAAVRTELDERTELHALMSRFLAANTPEEKVGFVRGGGAMLPAMRAYYTRHPDEPGGGYVPGPSTSSEMVNGRRFTLFGGRNRLDEPVETVAEHTPDGLKLDWRYLTASGDMEWDDWLRERPRRTVVMRGFARPDEFYAGPFADKAKWMCVKITDVEALSTVWAYVERAGSHGQSLLARLSGPESVQRVAGTFSFPENPGAFAAGTPQVLMTGTGEMGWLDESVPPEPGAKEKQPDR